jgi:hypothetical protein
VESFFDGGNTFMDSGGGLRVRSPAVVLSVSVVAPLLWAVVLICRYIYVFDRICSSPPCL